jgi:hypothetical protein
LTTSFNLAEHEDLAHAVGEGIDRRFQEAAELSCECLTLWTRRCVGGHQRLDGRVVVKGFVPALAANASQRLVDRNPREPRRKLR